MRLGDFWRWLRQIDLAGQVLIGFGAGIVAGLFLGDLAAPLTVVGTAFIRMLQITVLPYIIVALITGLGRLHIAEIGKLARSGGGVLLLFWALGICLILSMPIAYPDWPQRSLFQKSSVEPGTAVDFLLLFIPSNPFHAMANAIVPAMVVFSILIGLALTTTSRREAIIEPLAVLGEVLAKITKQVSRLSPIGVFALVAGMAGTTDAEDLFRLQVYLVVLIVVALTTALWLVPALLACVTPLEHRSFLREIRASLITAFATGSSLVVLPMLAEACKRLVDKHTLHFPAVERPEDEEQEANSSVDVLIPTFYSFPTVGNVLALGFVVFGGWYVGYPLGGSQFATLALGGIASLFGGTAIAIPFALDLVGLPAQLFEVFLSFDFIGMRLMTLLSVVHYAAIALIGTFALQKMLHIRVTNIVRSLIPAIAVVLLALTGLRFIYTHHIVVPYTADDVLAEARLLHAADTTTVHLVPPDEPLPGVPRTYAEIKQSGMFRACFLPGNYPLSFQNNEGELVGFDIEMAHRFTRKMGLTLTLLPLERLTDAPEKLDSGYCDAVFNSTTLLLDRIETTAQTIRISLGTIALVVPEARRKLFQTWQAIQDLGEIRIASSAYHVLLQSAVPSLASADFSVLQTFKSQRAFFESDGAGAEAFIDTAEEGAAWTVLYPRFSVVVPTPIIRIPVVYLTAKDNPILLEALNTWLQIELETGGVEKLEEYWIEGNRDAFRPPRWSIMRNALGWID